MTLHVLHLGRDGALMIPVSGAAPAADDPLASHREVAFVDAVGYAAGAVRLGNNKAAIDGLARSEAAVVTRGSVRVAGREVAAGSAFVLPAGFSGMVEGRADALWFFTSEPATPPAGDAAAVFLDPGLPRPASAGPPAEVLVGPKPSCHALNQFTGPGGMRAGVWDVMTPCERTFVPHRIHELMHLIDGEVTLTHRDGSASRFRAGDTLFLPQGAPYAWKSEGPVVKFYTVSA